MESYSKKHKNASSFNTFKEKFKNLNSDLCPYVSNLQDICLAGRFYLNN